MPISPERRSITDEALEQRSAVVAMNERRRTAEKLKSTVMLDTRLEDLGIHRREFGRPILARSIRDDLTSSLDSEAALSCTAVLFGDMNGLKAVNDLDSHANGDRYIHTVARHIAHPGKTVQTFLDKHHITVTSIATAGGDEFVITLQAEEPLDAKILGQLTRLIDEDIATEAGDGILDITKLEVQEKLLATFPAKERRQRRRELQQAIADGLRFRPSISFGAATALDGFHNARKSDRPINETTDPAVSLKAIVGETIRTADVRAGTAKTRYKRALAKKDRWLLAIYQANRENRRG